MLIPPMEICKFSNYEDVHSSRMVEKSNKRAHFKYITKKFPVKPDHLPSLTCSNIRNAFQHNMPTIFDEEDDEVWHLPDMNRQVNIQVNH